MSPGYGRILKDALDDQQLTKSEIVFLMTLSFYANGQAEYAVAEVSIPALAKRAGIGRNHAWTHLAKLARLGYITRLSPPGRHRRYSFLIHLKQKGPTSGPYAGSQQVPKSDLRRSQSGTLDRSQNGTAYKESRSSSRSSTKRSGKKENIASEEDAKKAFAGLDDGF